MLFCHKKHIIIKKTFFLFKKRVKISSVKHPLKRGFAYINLFKAPTRKKKILNKRLKIHLMTERPVSGPRVTPRKLLFRFIIYSEVRHKIR